MSVEHFPGTAQETLEAAAKLEPLAVVVLIQGHDETWTAHWSRMATKDLVFAERVLNRHIEARIWGRED